MVPMRNKKIIPQLHVSSTTPSYLELRDMEMVFVPGPKHEQGMYPASRQLWDLSDSKVSCASGTLIRQ